MNAWTLEYAGTIKTLAAWKLAEPQLTLQNQASDVFSVVAPAARADSEPIFPYLGEVILRYGDTIRFRGRRMAIDVTGSRKSEGIVYQFAGPWSYFERITFHQRWKTAAGYSLTSHVRVPGRFDDDNQLEYITTGEQIGEVIDFINASAGAVMTKGTLAPALQIPVDEKVDQKCSEIVRLMLGLTPDAICCFDYATTPPTFHCIQRAQLTARTIALSDKKISGLRLRQRDDMVPASVVVNYERVDVLDGASLPVYVRDAAPVGSVGTEDNALCQTVKLFGAEVIKVRGYVESLAIPSFPDVNWFIERGLLKDPDAIITDFEFTGSDGVLPYEIVGGLVQPWMNDSAGAGGSPAVTFQDEFRCVFAYEIPGRKKDTAKPGQVRINTTNIPTGYQSRVASSVSAEPVPVGLAAAVFNALSVTPFQGSVTLTEKEASGLVGLNNTLNISGGTGRYAAMNALVQSIDVDLDTGRTTLQLGPPKHLGIADLIELLRFNRTRRVYTNPSVQQDGSLGATDVTLDGAGPLQNASSAPGSPDSYSFGGTNGTKVEMGGITISPAAPPVANDAIRILLSDLTALSGNATVKFRAVTEIVKDANGNCTTQRRVYLCSDPF